MKALMVNNLYPPDVRGGAERSVQILAEALMEAGVEVTVASTGERSRPRAEINGVRVVAMRLPNLYWPFGNEQHASAARKLWHVIDLYNPLAKHALLRLIRAERPQVVHTHNLQGLSVAAWAAARAAGVPVLHTLRDYYLTCGRATRFRAGRNCARTCVSCLPLEATRRALSRQVQGVVGTGQVILARHLELGFFDRAVFRRVISNPAAGLVVRRRTLAVPMTFGFLGRLDPIKGIGTLLEAFESRSDSSWRLLLAGIGPREQTERWQRRAAQARRPDQIRFLGWTDASAFLSSIDILVMPSLWQEPLSRAVLDAMSSGIPVIASRRGGLTELVDDGVNGVLFDPEESRGLSDAIEQLLQNPARVTAMGDAARSSAGRFRPATIASQYLDAYQALLTGSTSHGG